MNPLKRTYRSLKSKGLVQTIRIATNFGADLLFDWHYGTDTRRWVPRDKIQTASENLADSQPYKATRSRPLLQLLRKLQLPHESNFVDIGAGKGRVVLIAAQYGFRKVVGVEFSAALCAIARENVKSFSAKKSGLSPMEIVEADATRHHLEADKIALESGIEVALVVDPLELPGPCIVGQFGSRGTGFSHEPGGGTGW